MRYTEKDVDKTITLVVSGKHEGNDSPWWFIINPRQVLETKSEQAIHNIAAMITGPFFSREEAQGHLDARRYAFGKNACVFAHSGYYSRQYKEALRKGVPVQPRKIINPNGGPVLPRTVKDNPTPGNTKPNPKRVWVCEECGHTFTDDEARQDACANQWGHKCKQHPCHKGQQCESYLTPHLQEEA